MLKRLAEIEEMFKQFEIGQNTGANAVLDVPNCEMNEDCVDNTGPDTIVDVPNCELNEEREVKEATLCFRVGGLVRNTDFEGIEDVKWFAIDGKGCISPYIKEPPIEKGCKNTPLVVGPSVFLISDVIKAIKFPNSKPFRVVHYLNLQNVYEEATTSWKKASYLVGEYARLCHFLVANDRIYACGFPNNGNTLCVCYIDCHKPDQGWYIESCSPTGSLEPSTIKFVTTDGKLGRCAHSALIFLEECLLSYDFDTKSFEKSEVFPYNEICCSHYDEGIFYLLIIDSDDRFCLMVYNHHDKKRDYTQVFGLDDYLPEDNTRHPKLRLVHLGNERLCLVWPLELRAKIKVLCTKFFVELLDGEYRATNVFSEVHTVEGFSLDNFEAVVVEKLTTGANSDGQISK